MAATITTDRLTRSLSDGRLEPVAATGRPISSPAALRAPRGFLDGDGQTAISRPASPRATKSETTIVFAAPRGFFPA